ncbi:MAG: GAF domain-containing protein, partial [Spirochaetes bacterium]|nr:GAF domain-containing protein [Spirochaetota bacterium]
IEIFEQSKEKFEKIGDIWELGMVEQGLGYTYHYIDNDKKSIESFSQYLEISKKIKDDYGISAAQTNLSYYYIKKGDFNEANELGIKSIKLSEENKIWYVNCFAKINFGYLEIERKKYQQAIKYLEQAKKLYENNTFLKDYTIYLYPYLADAYIEDYKLSKKKKELKKIKNACKKALTQTKSWLNHYGTSLRVAAKYYALINKKTKAKKYFHKSIAQTKSLGRRFEQAKGHYEYGNFLQAINKSEQAQNQWQQAYTIFKQIGAQAYIKRCAQFLGYKEEELATDTTSQERLSLDRRMTTVLNTGRYLSSILNLDELLEKIMDATMQLVGAERGILLLYPDKDKKKEHELEIKTVRNSKKITDTENFRLSSMIKKRMEEEAKPFIISDVQNDSVLKSLDSVIKSEIKSILSAPIMFKNEMLGNIYLDNRLVSGLFKEEDLKVLEMITNQAGVSIENARLVESLKEKERLKQEMKIAERIQTAIVPAPPQHDELEITAVMKPAEEVGG